MYKKLVLCACSLFVMGDVWGMVPGTSVAGEQKKGVADQYFLEYQGKRLPISKAGLQRLTVLGDFVDDEALIKNGAYVISIDTYLKTNGVSLAAVGAFIKFVDGVLALHEVSDDVLIDIVILVDLFNAQVLLDVSSAQLVGRIKDAHFLEFLQGKGLLWDMNIKMPDTVLDKKVLSLIKNLFFYEKGRWPC